MAELSKVKVVTKNGIVTATVLDKLGVDRMEIYMTKGSSSAQMSRSTDGTATVSRDIKEIVVFPYTTGRP